MKPSISLRLATVILCITGSALAQQSLTTAQPEKKTPWKAEDIIFAESAGQFRVSPDGKWAVWVKSAADKDKDGRIANLFLSNLETRKETQLTRGTESHGQPKWSPNSELISFISTRPLPKPNPDLSRGQIWLMSPFGGEPYHLTEFARGVQGYEWVDDNTIVFAAQEDPALYEKELKKKKDGTIVVDDVPHEPPVRLFRLNVKDKKVTRLTDNTDFIEAWAVTPDGKHAITTHAQYLSYAWDHKIPPKTFLYDLATGQRKELFPDGRIRPYFFRAARDGSGFYVIAPFTSHPKFFTATITLVYFYDLATGSSTQVDLGTPNGVSFAVEVLPDGFVTLLANGVRHKPARYVKNGSNWKRVDISGEHTSNIFGLTASDDGKILVYEYSTASTPEQWFRASLDGGALSNAAQITNINPSFKNKTIARTEVVRWRGANDEEVEGLLYYPHNYEAGKRYPLFTAPHGGPAGADFDQWDESWAYPHQLINQAGAFILKPNYHGSSNYGLAWVESICCGKYYDLEVPDIEKGVDALIARGLVDPDRIGTFGWSNGSILSIAVSIANPDRYKVVGAGAGDVEWISDWANVDFGQSFDSYYFGKSPLEDPQLYIQKSPLYKMDRVKAPTIIFFGTEDRNVPTSQGWIHYRALYHLGKVPVRFLLFPGEPHGLRRPTHQLRKVEEEQAWFDRYFFKSGKADNEAFRQDSPLGAALRRKSVARSGANYGTVTKPSDRTAKLLGLKITVSTGGGVLIPEVVRRGDLEIGRFEVTRAQFAAFDAGYKFDPGTENYPASGITFDKARAYAEWLSKLTAQTWRVPNEGEVASLYEGRSGENTLDYWAGYALNPDDAQRLAAKVKEMPGNAPLLKEVGSFAGAGPDEEELIFDLGGNVAEWVLAKDGSGKKLGGSAERAADSKAQRNEAAAEYTGFRVVRGAPKNKE